MNPTISSVCWTRNDNLRNMPYRCLMHLQSAVKEFDEVVIVDWCSPGKTFVQECYDYLPKTGKIKCIQVTEELVKSTISAPLKFSELSPTIMNVGLRRATSDFILATTADVISNRPDLSAMNEYTMYVNGRRGVPEKDYYKFDSVDDLREYLFTNYKKYPNSPDSVSADGKALWDKDDIWSLVVCVGDFMLAHKNIWNTIRGYEQINTVAGDTFIMKKVVNSGFKSTKIDVKAFHLNHAPPTHKTMSRQEYKSNYYDNVLRRENTSNPDNWGLIDIEFPIQVV